MPTPRPEVIPYLFYEDVPAALEFLSRAFGLTEEMRHAERQHARRDAAGRAAHHDGRWRQLVRHVQYASGWSGHDGSVCLSDDIDTHHTRARQAGATIDEAPHDVSYGRAYTARNIGGHPWFFTTPPAD